jgi:hypothetical protein
LKITDNSLTKYMLQWTRLKLLYNSNLVFAEKIQKGN